MCELIFALDVEGVPVRVVALELRLGAAGGNRVNMSSRAVASVRFRRQQQLGDQLLLCNQSGSM